jgi:hypothetical protein
MGGIWGMWGPGQPHGWVSLRTTETLSVVPGQVIERLLIAVT